MNELKQRLLQMARSTYGVIEEDAIEEIFESETQDDLDNILFYITELIGVTMYHLSQLRSEVADLTLEEVKGDRA